MWYTVVPSRSIIITLFRMYEGLFLDLLNGGSLILAIPLTHSDLNKVIAIISTILFAYICCRTNL